VTPEAKLQLVLRECRLTDGRAVGEAMADDPWVTERVLRPVFAVDATGRPSNRLAYIELPRGHWKTGGVAGIAVAEALVPSTDVVVAAADREQAGIVLENVDGYLARNPELGALFQRRGDERFTQQGSRIRVISSDAPTAFGLGGTHQRFRVIADELTAWRDDALWIALASATGKVEDAQTIVLSNAGFDAERSWQWEVRETAARAEWGYLFAADGVVASWITPEWIEQMRQLLPAASFERLIGNIWSTGSGDFVTAEQWRRCVDERLAPLAHGSNGRYLAGLDLGLTKDRSALAIVHSEDGAVVLDDLVVWAGTPVEPVSITMVERALVDAVKRFPGLRLWADPWQFKGSVERLRAAGLAIQEFVFSQGSVQKLSATLHHAISSAALRVYPDPELEREILGLRVVETSSGWRFDHRASGYSDRAVALAMAIQAALAAPSGTIRSFVPRARIPARTPGAGSFAERRRVALGLADRAADARVAAAIGVPLYDGQRELP
jgi:hypothetical protein